MTISNSSIFQQIDMSKAVEVICPVCESYAIDGAICGLCNGDRVALMLPNGALFPPKADK